VSTSKIALGTVQFGIDYGISSINGQVKPKEVRNILSYAHLKNIDLLDTAPAYGSSEQVLGGVNVQNFKVVTKTRHFNKTEIGIDEVTLMKKDFFRSLENLKKDSVYGVLMHNANDLLKPGSQQFFNQLENFKQDGKITKIGVSIYDHNQLQSILESFDIDMVQLPFNILDRRLIDSGMLATLQNRNIEVHARSIFLQGLLLMNEQDRPSKFKRWGALWKIWHEWLNDNHITALEATIRYAISMPEISKVLVGVNTKDQLKEIIIASDGLVLNIPPELYTNDVNLLNPTNWDRL
jgi:aryl-alcohol dehydrogenase-like predicted oxidoreductase